MSAAFTSEDGMHYNVNTSVKDGRMYNVIFPAVKIGEHDSESLLSEKYVPEKVVVYPSNLDESLVISFVACNNATKLGSKLRKVR